jgi:leucyl aminopeptidase
MLPSPDVHRPGKEPAQRGRVDVVRLPRGYGRAVLDADGGRHQWRLPLVDDYRQALKSEVADVGQIDTAKMGGGSIIGALFLERFAGDVPWAHLDIAGVGRAEKNRAELVKGGTAFGVRALLTWLESHPTN